jgi:hypothetical protein
LSASIAAFLGLSCALATGAPTLELAELQLSQARLPEALATLEALTDAGPLDRPSLVRALTMRLQLYAALKRPEDLSRDALDLAALEPDLQPDGLRPDARAAFLRAKSSAPVPPDITLVARERDDLFVVEATTTGAPTLVRSVRFAARTEGGAWTTSEGAPIVLPMEQAEHVEFYGSIVGPGGAVVAFHADAATPDRHVRSRPEVVAVTAPPEEDAAVWPWIAGGGAVVVAATVVTALLLSSRADTRVSVLPNMPNAPDGG